MSAYEDFLGHLAKKTEKQIESEIESMRRYMQKHRQAYAWHGKGITPPGDLPDGDKLSALREALAMKQNHRIDAFLAQTAEGAK